MGKAKKELTNQRRAARLGTGQGIAPARKQKGGIPPWAWLIGGSVLLAAVIVAVAVIATRSSSSAASGGQDAAVVQDRLSHGKVDFQTLGYWPVNYTNLDGALTALGLAPNPSATGLAVHYHWHLDLFVGGRRVVVPRNIGLQNPPAMSSDIHTHDTNVDAHSGIIHVESPAPHFRATILDLFDVWGVYASNQCIGGYCGGVKVWVDGQISPAGLSTEPAEHAAVTVAAGPLPPGVKPAVKYTGFAAGE
jgi:hypothetical protein